MTAERRAVMTEWDHHTRALKFMSLQLFELSEVFNSAIESDQVTFQFISKMQDTLEKIYKKSCDVCRPMKQPTMEDFRPIRPIGSGGFGDVCLVSHKTSYKLFAMKTIKHKTSSRSRTLLECDILNFTMHPFVVSIFCSFETKEEMCILMEYAEGGDCSTRLKQAGKLPWLEVRKYAAETILALEHIHNYGIVHRDIKPTNMLLTSTCHIKLADFGLALIGPVNMLMDRKRVNINNIVNEFAVKEKAGTPPYMAPEMFLSNGYGKPIDWWALGVTLYQLLVGSLPFFEKPGLKLRNIILYDELTWPYNTFVPNVVKDFIGRLLTKNPKRRLGTAGAWEVKAHPCFNSLHWNDLLNL